MYLNRYGLSLVLHLEGITTNCCFLHRTYDTTFYFFLFFELMFFQVDLFIGFYSITGVDANDCAGVEV